jgi:phage tail tape-measure protein
METTMKTGLRETGHTNPDAITGAPGSHPGATGVGAASGAATGAAIGAIGGPVGAVIGGVAGAAVGGLAGHSIGEWNDPSDATYWKGEYRNRSYYDENADYDTDVVPALSYGSRLRRDRTAGTSSFSSIEDKVKAEWNKIRGKSKYSYGQARPMISDAYEREI